MHEAQRCCWFADVWMGWSAESTCRVRQSDCVHWHDRLLQTHNSRGGRQGSVQGAFAISVITVLRGMISISLLAPARAAQQQLCKLYETDRKQALH